MRMFPLLPILCAGLFAFDSSLNAAETRNGPSQLVVGETLEDFFDAAIGFSPSLRIAEESLNIGRARERQAEGQLRPQINANANLTNNSRNSFSQFGTPISEDFDGERFSVSLQQTLFNSRPMPHAVAHKLKMS